MTAPPQKSPRRLFSPASAEERARAGRRLLWALPVAVGVLLLLALLGPDADSIERKFTPYGATGPLRLMPEISIEDSDDPEHQRAAVQADPPPAAPRYQVEPEDFAPAAEEKAPLHRDETSEITGMGEATSQLEETDVAIAADGDAAVDMDMPSQQVDSDFIIRKLVRPLYPPGASEADRRKPVVTVQAAFFLNEQAEIVAVMIQSNDGGPEFAAEVQTAMEQWEFEPRLRDGQPPAPRWLVVTWRFRSPFSPQAAP